MRRCLAFLICLLLLTALALPVYGADAQASEVVSEVLVDENGRCSVTTTVTMEVPAGMDTVELPLPEGASHIVLAGYKFKRAGGDGSTLLRIEVPGSGTQTFRLSYTLSRAAEETSKGQLLTLPLLPPGWDCTIDHYQLTLTMPEVWESAPKFVSTYYGDLADNYLRITTEENVLTVTSLQQIMDHDALTMTLQLPDHYFRLRHLAGKAAPFAVLGFWLLALACLVYWFLRLFLRPGPIHRTSMAPEGSNAGTLSYQLSGGAPELGLMVLHWASLGYLTVERRGGRVYLVRQMDMGTERKPYEALIFDRLFAGGDVCSHRSPHYQAAAQCAEAKVRGYWYKKLFSRRHGGKPWVLRLLGALAAGAVTLCAMDRAAAPTAARWALILPLTLVGILGAYLLQDAAQLPFCRRPLPGCLICAGSALLLLVLGSIGHALPLMLAAIVLQLTVSVMVLPGGRRTAVGRERLFSLLGLRAYLTWTHGAVLRDLLGEDPQYYYRTLPTAEALGAGKAFTRKFGNYPLEACGWLLRDGAAPKNANQFYALFSETLDLLQGQEAAKKPTAKPRAGLTSLIPARGSRRDNGE